MKPIPSVLAAPWAIEPTWLRVVFGVWSRGKIDAAALQQARADWEARKASRPRIDEPSAPVEGTGGTLRITGNVGVISVEGPLFRHASLFSDISGGTSYDAIWRGLEAALSNRSVASILFRFDTPGGEADGVNELAKAIRAAREHKPVWAYVDGMCASAGYWLASQTQHIIAEETSEVGSIGVRCGIVDYSAQDEMRGVREIEVISSQSPGKRSKPVDDEVVGRLQVRIDDLADLFVAAVAEGRGEDVETVLADFGKGDVMIASKAVSAGLIDEIGNFNGALTAVAAAQPRGRSARVEDHMTKNASDADNEWKCEGCSEMMGPSAKKFCAKCAEPDGDEDEDDDEDEDEAKALGLDPKATADQRRMRMVALVELETKVLATTGAKKLDAALAVLEDAMSAREQVAKVCAVGRSAALRVTLERGLAGSPGKQPTLSLGQIQKTMAVALRGPTKKAWLAAVDKLANDAHVANTTITAAQVIDAVCSVPISDEDLESLQDYVAASAPVAASTFVEPARNGEDESAELDPVAAEVSRLANNARAVLDRNNKPAAK